MRFDLSNRTEFARRVLTYLAMNGAGSHKGAQLAEIAGTTRYYLPPVMHPLVAAGWVVSEPGPTGGYRLTPQAHTATLWDLVTVMERTIDDGRCVLTGEWCHPEVPCSVHGAWKKARMVLEEELAAEMAIDLTRGVR
jgi:Rrf2 family protein